MDGECPGEGGTCLMNERQISRAAIRLAVLLILTIIGCSPQKAATIKSKRAQVASKVSVGDDIFRAKDVLEADGFRIKYGPDFPTKSRSYYMMIVDYGLTPGELDKLRYALGVQGGEPIAGLIRADPAGKIISIE